jgi:hypothetical protein
MAKRGRLQIITLPHAGMTLVPATLMPSSRLQLDDRERYLRPHNEPFYTQRSQMASSRRPQMQLSPLI